ncbi:MAG: ATPase [Burkholderiales bacterium]
MADPLVVAKAGDTELAILPAMSNRHGLITGATGTGKTISLQVLAEHFSRIGVPTFMADVKGDLTGIAFPGSLSPKLEDRLDKLGLPEPTWGGSPVTLWDVWGEQGHPVRTTVSDMGPLLFARLLNLNETQEGVLALTFKVADDGKLPLLDLKDLRAVLQYVGDNAAQIKTQYGNVSPASIGAIQRGLLQLEEQGGDKFFGEPMLNVDDLIQTDAKGRGIVNIIAADKLMTAPRLYASFLLWLLADLYENLPEVGDRDKPKLVFFFDEAHLLFAEAPPALQDKIEQVVRLIRSKGVGVFFVTQNPLDVPDKVLGQLGNRIQHALRAFTPRDQKAVKSVADTMRPNPKLDIGKAILELATGEALVSFLDAKGSPGVTERAWMFAPGSRIGPITADERAKLIAGSVVAGTYDRAVDRESAYEMLKARMGTAAGTPAAGEAPVGQPASPPAGGGVLGGLSDILFGSTGPRGGRRDGMVDLVAKSAARTMGSSIAREITRGVLGSLLGGGRKR